MAILVLQRLLLGVVGHGERREIETGMGEQDGAGMLEHVLVDPFQPGLAAHPFEPSRHAMDGFARRVVDHVWGLENEIRLLPFDDLLPERSEEVRRLLALVGFVGPGRRPVDDALPGVDGSGVEAHAPFQRQDRPVPRSRVEVDQKIPFDDREVGLEHQVRLPAVLRGIPFPSLRRLQQPVELVPGQEDLGPLLLHLRD